MPSKTKVVVTMSLLEKAQRMLDEDEGLDVVQWKSEKVM